MNPESWHTFPTPNPEVVPSMEADRSKEEIVEDIRRVLSFRLGISEISNPEPVLQELFDSLVHDVEDLSRQYAEAHPEVEDKQIREDNALAEAGFGNVPAVLDKIQEVRILLSERIPHMAELFTSDVITPPDEGGEIKVGDGSGFKEVGIMPRLKMLLFVLLNDCNLSEGSISITRGSVNNNMMRREPYVAVDVPDLHRLVVVCDEEGNRTDVFDTSHPAYAPGGKEGVLLLTKDEKNEFGEMNPGAHHVLRHSNTWSDRIYSALTKSLIHKESVSIRPETFSQMTSIGDGLFEDVYGNKYASMHSFCETVMGAGGLWRNKAFPGLLANLSIYPIRMQGRNVQLYNIEHIKSAMAKDPELSAYFNRAGERDIFVDGEGREWMSWTNFRSVHLGSASKLGQKLGIEEWIKDVPRKQVIFGTKRAEAYDVELLKKRLLEHEVFSAYFRLAEQGVFVDETGERWVTKSNILQRQFGADLVNNSSMKKFWQRFGVRIYYLDPILYLDIVYLK